MSRKIMQGVTIAYSTVLLEDQLYFLKQKGFQIQLVCNNDEKKIIENIPIKHIPFAREINLKQDLYTLYKLYKHMKQEKPDIINFSTPKAGLLGMIAGFLTRIDNRIYIQRGLRLETEKGLKKYVLYLTEKISCSLSTHIIVISDSLEQEILRLRLASKDKIVRLGKGSSDGINLVKYNLQNIEIDKLDIIKKELKIKSEDFVYGYVGRISKDKGAEELIEAFLKLSESKQNIKLLLIGNIESLSAINNKYLEIVNNHKNIKHLEHQTDLEYYYDLMDVFVFPTHREGFGNVSIEAQAMKTPVITYNSTGSVDTIEHNKTGLHVEKKNTEHLYEAMKYLLDNPGELKKLKRNTRNFVSNNFDRKIIQNELLEFYNNL